VIAIGSAREIYIFVKESDPVFQHCCSSTLGSATNQVYQALAQLLKLCDDVLLHGDQSSALDTENVTHVIGLVEEAVKNLVALAHEKIANKQKPASITNNNR